jgi:hypothetical protein
MDPIQIAVVNHSRLDDASVAKAVAALQKQVSEDFGPVWRLDAQLQHVTKDCLTARLPDHWGLILLDGEEDTRGYHQLTANGYPLGKVFVNETPPGQDWTHTASHELLEMLADPDANLAVFCGEGSGPSRFYSREVCDPCAAYADGYPINGWQVSNFVFPTWFQPSMKGRDADHRRYDERRSISAPFQVRPGGYIGVFDPDTPGWRVLGHDGVVRDAERGRLARRAVPADEVRISDSTWGP